MLPILAVNPAPGLEPQMRNLLPGYDSGVLTLIVVAFLAMVVGFRALRRLGSIFFAELVQGHDSAKVAGEHTTSENWSVAAMLVQTLICEGLMLFSSLFVSGHLSFASQSAYTQMALVAVGIAAVVFFIQLIGYITVGYAFAPTPDDSGAWVRAFCTTQAMMGMFLLVPTIGAMFYPKVAPLLLWLGVGFYVAFRMAFIIKSLRIFYDQIGSLFYFFLYLCTLEMLPLVLAMKAMRLVSVSGLSLIF